MAVTLDFGKCAACGESNSKTLQNCRACSAALPWAKASKSAPDAGQKMTASKPKIGLGDVDWGPMAVQLLGGLIFVIGIGLKLGNILGFFPTFPGAGYITMIIGGVLWGVGQNMD